MKWNDKQETSRNIEDRRGSGLRGGGIRLGLGGLVVVGILSLVTGQNFFALLDPSMIDSAMTGSGNSANQASYQPTPEEEKLVKFVSFVLDDTEQVWTNILPQYGQRYPAPKLVLFSGYVDSACGAAQAAMGPFYCPADQKVYIDLSFYQELKQRFGAPGDFAQAYVIAHEVGHHVQNVLGYSTQVREAQQRQPSQANALSVRQELQADCLAGVWGKATSQRGVLEAGDVEEGIEAAAAVGDDRMQKQATGQINAEKWTHGSSRQRVAWFMHGMRTGDVRACDTYKNRLPEDTMQ